MDWIRYIKEDENSAIKELYRKTRNPSLNWLRKNTSLQEADITEIYQTAIVVLYDNVKTGKLKELTANVQTYILGICKNKALELYRRSKKTKFIAEMPIIEELGNEHILYKKTLEDKIKQLDNGINSIGDPCRSIIQLYYYKKLSMKEITAIMGYKNSDTTKNLKYKCLKRLQSALQKHTIISSES